MFDISLSNIVFGHIPWGAIIVLGGVVLLALIMIIRIYSMHPEDFY